MKDYKFISKDCAEEITAAAGEKIIEVIGRTVQLRKAGSNWVGICPFCRHAKPKFSVNEKLQIFKCFACQKGGKPIKFIMDLKGLNYPDALRYAGEVCNVLIY